MTPDEKELFRGLLEADVLPSGWAVVATGYYYNPDGSLKVTRPLAWLRDLRDHSYG